MVTCNICSKEFKTTQGLKGHKTFKHGNGSSGNDSASHSASKQQPNELLERLQKLESITGVNKQGELDESSVRNDKSLTQQVGQVGQLGEQLEHTQTTKEMLDSLKVEHDKQLEQLSNSYNIAYHKISNIVNKNSELINKIFSITEDGTKAINKQFNALGNRIGQLEGQVQTKLALSNKLCNKLDAIEQKLADFDGEFGVVRNLIRRQPTGKIVCHPLYEAHSRDYKEYRDPEGLDRPYKYSRDLIFGDRWIDLAEPEN